MLITQAQDCNPLFNHKGALDQRFPSPVCGSVNMLKPEAEAEKVI